jgi:hypothetical protein
MRWLPRVTALCFALAASTPPAAEERLVDTGQSIVTVHVATEGLLGAAVADHVIQAPLDEGSVQESPTPHMQIVIDARRLRVVDADLSRADREKVQARTLGPDVLDVARFPRITYHSITIEQRASDWLVHGELELHGQILPVKATARREGGRYRGTATVRQSDFGITPVRMWGGLVRVKDEVGVEFDIALAGPP